MSKKGKRMWWIRFTRHFFNRHDILDLESLPRGKMIAYFYTKLITLSIDHNGYLRFNSTLPYTYEQLATLTRFNTKIKVFGVLFVKRAISELKKRGMIEIKEDGALFIPYVPENLDSLTFAALKMRQLRSQNKSEA